MTAFANTQLSAKAVSILEDCHKTGPTACVQNKGVKKLWQSVMISLEPYVT